jgi:hypothetical protein
MEPALWLSSTVAWGHRELYKSHGFDVVRHSFTLNPQRSARSSVSHIDETQRGSGVATALVVVRTVC